MRKNHSWSKVLNILKVLSFALVAFSLLISVKHRRNFFPEQKKLDYGYYDSNGKFQLNTEKYDIIDENDPEEIKARKLFEINRDRSKEVPWEKRLIGNSKIGK